MSNLKITQCKGDGQGSCKRCTDNGKWNVNWMCFLYKIDGLEGCYCADCVKEIKENEVFEHVSNLAGDYKCFDEKLTYEESLILCNLIEEIQRYQAIGTVEEFKRAKEMEAVYGQVKWERDIAISQLEEIGVGLGQKMDEFKALKEKSVAKKPDYEGDGCWDGHVVIDTWICPNCGKLYEVDYDDYDYCPNCGQHIDHSGLTEDD